MGVQVSDTHKRMLKEISISMNICKSLLAVSYKYSEDDPIIQFGLLRSISVEVDNIACLVKKLPLPSKLVQKTFPFHKLFRDSICHIEQRVDFEAKVPRKEKKNLNWETVSLADGLAYSEDGGKTWTTTASLMFNFEVAEGIGTSIGMLDDYLVCLTESGGISQKVSEDKISTLEADLAKAVGKITLPK